VRLRLVLCALLAGCALDHQLPDGGFGVEVTIGGIQLRAASAGARAGGSSLTLYLTDQPDACLATSQIPVGRATIFELKVAPPSGGTATVVPGEGDLTVQVGGLKTSGYDASDGSVTWTVNGDGTYTIATMDVGFAGTGDRLRLANLVLLPCP
jgi:hypothetical protein